jgi:hypothetical protein
MELDIVGALEKTSKEIQKTFRRSIIACPVKIGTVLKHFVYPVKSSVQIGATPIGIE